MKILMISLGSDITLGKGNRTINRHINYARKANSEIVMILLSPIKNNTNYSKKIDINKLLTIYPIASKNHIYLILKAIIKAVYISRKNNFDLIYSQDPFGTALIGSLIRYLFKIPLIIGNHSSFVDNNLWLNERPIYFRILNFFLKINIKNADAWRVNNKKEKDKYINKFKIDPKKIFVNHTLINTKSFTKDFKNKELKEIKGKLSNKKDTRFLIWAGRPVKVKRLDFLINSFKYINEKMPNTKLIIVGDFSLNKNALKNLKNFNPNLNKDIIIYDKGVNHELLAKLFKVADIYLHTSSYEGFGVVLAEAALSGLPIVSTYNDGVLEIVENKKTGFIVKEHLPLDFAKIAIKILKNDSLRKNLAKNAKKTALLKFDRNINLEKRAWLWRKVSESGFNSKVDLSEFSQ